MGFFDDPEGNIPSYNLLQAMLAPVVPSVMSDKQRADWQRRTGFGTPLATQASNYLSAEPPAPTPMATPAPTPMALPAGAGAQAPMGGLGTLGALAPQQQQQPNMFIDPATGRPYSAKQLAAPVNVGGSSSYSKQVTPGMKSLPGYTQALDRLAGQQATATRAGAEAASMGAQQRAAAFKAHQAAMVQRQAAHQAAQAVNRAKVEQYDAEAAKIRSEIATQKVDPEQWWSSKTASQRAGMALGVSLSAFAQLKLGRGGPNPVMQMIDTAIARDIDAQKANLVAKRGQLGDVRGALADVYRRIGDMDQAEQQTRILMMEGMKSKLEQIGATTQSALIRHNAELGIGELGGKILEAKNLAFQKAQDRVVKTSSGSNTRAPLFKVLQAAQAAQAAQQKKGPAVDKSTQVSEKLRQRLATANRLRRDMAKFYHDYKALGLPAGATNWWGGKGAAVKEQGDRILDNFVLMNPNASTEHLKLFKGLLGGKYASDADVKLRLKNIAEEVDNAATTLLEGEADAGMVIAPFVQREAQYRNLVRQAIGH